MLSIAYETQEVLLDASNQLHRQGKQIDSSARTLEKIHNDITVAERITGDIESWFGAWRVKGKFEAVKVDTNRTSSPLGQQSIDYPVLYATVAQESHKSGQIVLKDGKFELLNEKYEIVHSFAVDKISEVDIHSPWDVTIIKRTFGKPLVRIHLTSARMPVLLKRLQQCKGPEYDLDTLPQEATIVDSVEELDSNESGIALNWLKLCAKLILPNFEDSKQTNDYYCLKTIKRSHRAIKCEIYIHLRYFF